VTKCSSVLPWRAINVWALHFAAQILLSIALSDKIAGVLQYNGEAIARKNTAITTKSVVEQYEYP